MEHQYPNLEELPKILSDRKALNLDFEIISGYLRNIVKSTIIVTFTIFTPITEFGKSVGLPWAEICSFVEVPLSLLVSS